jgi:ribose-phosphate pyrophosphokinase
MPRRESDPLGNVRIFAGNAHQVLAEEICDYLGVSLSPTKAGQFSNGCLYIQLRGSVREKDVFIVQSFCPPRMSDYVLECLMLLDAARSASARRIHVVIPYFSYSRSDKKDEPHICITARLMADLLVAAGASHVMTMTLHSPQVHGFFSVPTDHLSAISVLARHFKDRDLEDVVVMAPDIGHAKQATHFARVLGGVPVAAANKQRVDDLTVRVEGIIGDVRGKRVILIDDEVAAGGSIEEVIRVLRSERVDEVTVVCTHGVFSGPAVERLSGIPELVEIVTTNTVPIPPDKRQRLPNVTVLSVAPVFGEAIRCNCLGLSVGPHVSY